MSPGLARANPSESPPPLPSVLIVDDSVVARTVMALLSHGRTLAADEADAAGVALCHAFTWRE